MNESKPVDLEAIMAMPDYDFLDSGRVHVTALCAEVESLRARVKALEAEDTKNLEYIKSLVKEIR